jgi:bifunctional non-homologous end joining protein LigD
MREYGILEAYGQKQILGRQSPDPTGETRPNDREAPFFVQKHNARTLRSDRRLEITLKNQRRKTVREKAVSSLDSVIRKVRHLMGKKQRLHKAARDMPLHVEPMLALPFEMPNNAEDYAFEYKWDGIRALYYWDGTRVRIESRNKLDMTHRWPELIKLGETFGAIAAILDGEIVALDTLGRVSFGLLSSRMHLPSSPTARQMSFAPVVFMIFDILYLQDHVLMPLSYTHRRAVLEDLNLSSETWQIPPSHGENPAAMLEAAIQNGMEGLVAKRLDSAYLPGRRTEAWLKIKPVKRQEFVIGGWIPIRGSANRGVGALLVGFCDRSRRLVFAGKVGTGFTDAARKDLEERFKPIARNGSPFATAAPSKGVKFVEPRMVAEVEFYEWTSDGKLRHPSFKGLRADKDPREIVREDAV